MINELFEQSQHDINGPSNLERRAHCPGSRRLEAILPEQTSTDAERGTDLHEIVNRRLDVLGSPGEDTVRAECALLEPDEQEAVEYALGVVRDEATRMGEGAAIEYRMSLSMKLPGGRTISGTPDLLIYSIDLDCDRVTVVDWKFGWGDVTEAKGNWQLAAYAIMAAEYLGVERVRVVLARPFQRSLTIDELGAADLARWRERIVQVIDATERPDAPLVPGPWCKYCRAGMTASCPALRERVSELATTKPAVDALSVEQLGELLDRITVVESIIAAAKKRAHQILESGGEIPGWTLQEGRGTREFTPDAETRLREIAERLGKDARAIWQPAELSSPAQIERTWGKSKQVREAIEPLIVHKPGRKHLVQISQINDGVKQ